MDQSERTFNQGGHPLGGQVLQSTAYRLSLDAIGDGLLGAALRSASYSMDGGFTRSYAPAGEVTRLLFEADKVTLAWCPEPSVGTYDVYSGLLGELPGSYGTCRLEQIQGEGAFVPEVPDGTEGYQGFFYLVTATNRLNEEGTKGSDSTGRPRGNPVPCP